MKVHRLTYLALWGASIALMHLTHGYVHVFYALGAAGWCISYIAALVIDLRGWLRKRRAPKTSHDFPWVTITRSRP